MKYGQWNKEGEERLNTEIKKEKWQKNENIGKEERGYYKDEKNQKRQRGKEGTGHEEKLKTKLRGFSPQANYTERPPHDDEVSAKFCG
jgi:hypothetical protein